MELDDDGNVIAESMKRDRVYLADETGWGVQTKGKKVIAKKGANHVYHRKSNDESHKTLMLGICGNGVVLKLLVILENSFPLLAEGEGEHIPDDILLSKTDKGSMEKELFVEWIENAVITHKRKVNPDGISYLILDNHGSRFSTKAIDLCIENHIEVLCYPGHLTHILQGPDVVLNKPISTRVDKMIHNNPIISGNSNLSRIAFIAIIIEAVKTVCTKEKVLMAFSATGVIPFNPQRIDLSKYPSSMSSTPGISDSPAKVKCRDCRVKDVAIHPLVKNGMVPKHLAEVMLYTPPPEIPKTQSKVVKSARVITSEAVRTEIEAKEEKRRNEKEKKEKRKEELEKKRKSKERKTSKKLTQKKNSASRRSAKTSLKRLIAAAKENREEESMDSEDSEEESERVVTVTRKRKSGSKISSEESSEEGDEEEEDEEEVDEDRGETSEQGQEKEDDGDLNLNLDMAVSEEPMAYDDVSAGMWVVVMYEGERFLGKVIQKKCGEYLVKCLSMPFGVRIPQQYEDDEGVYYTEVFQTDIVPENKRIIKDGKKSREYYWVY